MKGTFHQATAARERAATRASGEQQVEGTREASWGTSAGRRAGLSASSRVTRAFRLAVLAVAVALVLADSSVVVLALPDVLGTFGASITRVAWVLVAFNLVLALAAVPAARLSRRVGARRVMTVGLGLLGLASAGCAVAGSIDVLIVLRCLQAVGAAAVAASVLELFTEVLRDERRAARMWTASGAAGAALGPGIGGVLTQLFSWRAVFVVQVPLAVALIVGLVGMGATAVLGTPIERPRVAPNISLGLLSAALTAALFLLVLMLVDGWRMSPVASALTVSVMPAVALVSARWTARAGSPRVRAAVGCILVGGGLAALGELPRGTPAWTVAPQAAVGLGLAFALSSLTEAALENRSPEAVHGAWTLAARHAGVVLGLLVLTPVFSADLTRQTAAAQESGSAIVLDANLPLGAKLALGAALMRQVQRTPDHVPDLAPAFQLQHATPLQRPEFARVERALDGQVRRAGTAAFARAFGVAAFIALLALLPAAFARRRERREVSG